MNARTKSFISLLAFFQCAGAFAITDEEIFRNFQFSFVNPGARATAMGNAFIALADDATAAEANPAGLTILNKPEVSFEFRNIQYDSETLNALNNVQTDAAGSIFIASSNNLETVRRPSFFSFVYPKGRTTFAFSRQEALRIKGSIDEAFDLPDQKVQQFAFGDLNQVIVNWNFSVAAKIHDRLSVGASLRLSRLSWEATVKNSQLFEDMLFCDDPCIIELFETTTTANQNAFAWNAGVIYRLNNNFRVGGVFKRNARFMATGVESGESALDPGPFRNEFKVPDVAGIGVAFQPSENITITADLVHVNYSSFTERLEAARNILTFLYKRNNLRYSTDNALEVHGGAEFFVFWKYIPIAIRQGIYRKPSNSLSVASAEGLGPDDQLILNEAFHQTEDEIHVTIGNGFVFSNFQVDWAFDYSKSSSQFVVSTVARF